MSELIKIEWEDWVKQYRPIKNHLDNNASSDGYMFETYDEERNFVRRQNPLNVWTLVDYGDGSVICEGYHLVNRLGYFVTEVQYDPQNQYNVDDDPDEYHDLYVDGIDTELLHSQYEGLIAIQNRTPELTPAEKETLEGVINMIEAMMDNNPEYFPKEEE